MSDGETATPGGGPSGRSPDPASDEASSKGSDGTTRPGEGETLGPRALRIVNLKGLHARASARFVETVQRHDAAVLVEKDGEEVPGTDLLGLLMLAGTRGSTIEVSASGPAAAAVLNELEALVASGFGEGE